MRYSVRKLKRRGKKTSTWYLIPSMPDPVTGKRTPIATGMTNKEDAEEFGRSLARSKNRAAAGLEDDVPRFPTMTWEQLVTKHQAHCQATKRGKTAEAYAYSFAAFKRLMEPGFLREIDHALLMQFAAQRRGEVSAVTVNKDLRAIRAALRWGEEMKFLPRAPKFKGVFLRQNVFKPVVVRDFQKIVDTLDAGTVKLTMRPAAWWKEFLKIAHGCGCRRGELLGLTWENVFLDAQQPEIRVDPATSKGRRERFIPLAADLVALLRAWRQENPEERHVLPWPYATAKQLYVDLDRIEAASGVKFVPKHLRSTCGTELIETGTDLATVRDILGHSTIMTTAGSYTNTSQAMRDAVARRAEKNGRKGA